MSLHPPDRGCHHLIHLHVTYILQEEKKELDEITAKRQKRGRVEDEAPGEEKTILHSNLNIFTSNICMAHYEIFYYFTFSCKRLIVETFHLPIFVILFSHQSKTCLTTRADLTSTSHRMWVSVYGPQMLQISVTCPKNSFTSGLDTQR